MDGPVTYAHAQRGEIPMHGGGQPQNLPQQQDKGSSSDILAQDGLKLRLELNLDIEIELKMSIHGGSDVGCDKLACRRPNQLASNSFPASCVAQLIFPILS
jgi:hypothetical protein